MSYDRARLREIYDRTSGRCHVCGKRLSIENYAQPGARGAWEVEHSRARATGGTDHVNNLFAACISCNRRKGTYSSRTARAWMGRKRSPMSKDEKEKRRKGNTALGAGVGAVVGAAAGGPPGLLIGAFLGGLLGNRDPEES